jgi:hypothetical protein
VQETAADVGSVRCGVSCSLRRRGSVSILCDTILQDMETDTLISMEITAPNLSIVQAHFACLDAFESFLELPALDPGSPRLDHQAIRDAFDKYKLWAGNMGAMHSGEQWKMSLDYRLREASFYKVQVLTLSITHLLVG